MAYRTLKSMARNLEFNDTSEAADYIMQSYLNGQHAQAKRLYMGLTKAERTKAVDYFRESGYDYRTMSDAVMGFYA